MANLCVLLGLQIGHLDIAPPGLYSQEVFHSTSLGRKGWSWTNRRLDKSGSPTQIQWNRTSFRWRVSEPQPLYRQRQTFFWQDNKICPRAAAHSPNPQTFADFDVYGISFHLKARLPLPLLLFCAFRSNFAIFHCFFASNHSSVFTGCWKRRNTEANAVSKKSSSLSENPSLPGRLHAVCLPWE